MRCSCIVLALGLGAVLVGCTATEVTDPGVQSAIAGSGRVVVISPTEITLAPGGTQQFSAQLFQDGKPRKATFVWSTSDPAIATVSASGLVTAVGDGQATITATSHPPASGTARVTVQGPPAVVATVPIGGTPFGSTVSAPGTGWIGQLFGTSASRLDIAGAAFTGSAPTGPAGSLPVHLAPNAAGTRVYAANFGGIVASINTATLAIVDTVRVVGDAYGVIATPSGDTVFAGVTDGNIYKIALASGTILNTLVLPTAASYHFAWNSGRTLLYASSRGFGDGRVYELNPFTLEVVRTFPTGGLSQAIALSADESKLFVADEFGDVIVWDIASNTRTGTISTGCQSFGLVRTPDNSRMYVSCSQNGLVVVVNPATGAMIATLNVGGRPRELAYDAATKSVIVPNESGWVDIIR